MTDAGEDFYRHAVSMLREAELAENALRHRLSEPKGTIRCTSGVATMQCAMTGIVSDFLIRHPKVNIVVHACDRAIDIVGENFDIAIKAHSEPLPYFNLVQRDARTGAHGSCSRDPTILPRMENHRSLKTSGIILRFS